MKVSEVKEAFGKKVIYDGSCYKLTAYILKLGEDGKLRYQLELKDLNARSVVIAPMENVEVSND